MDNAKCPCLAERPPSVPPRIRALAFEDGPFRVEPSRIDPKQILRREDWIDLFKARQYNVTVGQRREAVGNDESEFDQGWIEAEEEQKRSNPFLNLHGGDRKSAERIEGWRASVARHILTLEDGALVGLSHEDAIARHRVSGMLYAHYRFDTCLECRKWLDLTKTDTRADVLLRHLVALVVDLGEPVPVGLRDWASAALFVDCPRHVGRPKMNWRRDQKITLAVDVLEEVTHSSVGNALRIVAEVCRENGIVDMDPEDIKTIRNRVRRQAQEGEANAVM